LKSGALNTKKCHSVSYWR